MALVLTGELLDNAVLDMPGKVAGMVGDTLADQGAGTITLDLDELAHACAVAPDWVVAHVQAGVLEAAAGPPAWRFSGADLRRARRLLSLERDFDADEELAALVVDLVDEVSRLRTRLRAIGAL